MLASQTGKLQKGLQPNTRPPRTWQMRQQQQPQPGPSALLPITSSSTLRNRAPRRSQGGPGRSLARWGKAIRWASNCFAKGTAIVDLGMPRTAMILHACVCDHWQASREAEEDQEAAAAHALEELGDDDYESL